MGYWVIVGVRVVSQVIRNKATGSLCLGNFFALRERGTAVTQRNFVLRFILFGALLLCGCSNQASQAAKPNVIIIVIDALRQDALSCYGAKRETPNIDALAARSVLFMEAYCTMPTTLPSHTSLFTGLYPETAGVPANAHKVDSKLHTLAEILREHGYQTGAVVSSFALASKWNIQQGFDVYRETDEKDQAHAMFGHFKIPERTTEEALELINFLNSPFFLWIHYFDPHSPYEPSETVYAQERVDTSIDTLLGIFREMQDLPDGIQYDDEYLENLRDLYDDEVRIIDAHIGRLIAEFERKGLFDNSIIILCSDHGEAFGEHRTMVHTWGLWPETIVVPLMFYSPGLSAIRVHYPVSLVDVTPTILEFLRIPKRKVEGNSLFNPNLRRFIVIEQRDTTGQVWESRFPRSKIVKEILPRKPLSPTLSASDREKLEALGYLR